MINIWPYFYNKGLMVFLQKNKKDKYWHAFQILLSHKEKRKKEKKSQIPKSELKKEKSNKL